MIVQEYQHYTEGLYGIWLRLAETPRGWTYGFSIALPGLVLGQNLHKDPENNLFFGAHKNFAVEQGLYTIYTIIEQHERDINHEYQCDLAGKIIDKFFNQTNSADMRQPDYVTAIPLIDLLWML
jgi:hypothetical protein